MVGTPYSPFYHTGNENASGDGHDQNPPMPDQDVDRVLIDAAELQHRETQKTGDRTQRASKSAGGERNPAPGEQPEQNSAGNRDRRSFNKQGHPLETNASAPRQGNNRAAPVRNPTPKYAQESFAGIFCWLPGRICQARTSEKSDTPTARIATMPRACHACSVRNPVTPIMAIRAAANTRKSTQTAPSTHGPTAAGFTGWSEAAQGAADFAMEIRRELRGGSKLQQPVDFLVNLRIG